MRADMMMSFQTNRSWVRLMRERWEVIHKHIAESDTILYGCI